MRGLVRTIHCRRSRHHSARLEAASVDVDELTVSGEAADGEAVHRLLNESSPIFSYSISACRVERVSVHRQR